MLATDVSAPSMKWAEWAACSDPQVDRNWFFPGRGQYRTAAKAKAVCARCPVRLQCLEYANATFQEFGIWGGLSEKERKQTRGSDARTDA